MLIAKTINFFPNPDRATQITYPVAVELHDMGGGFNVQLFGAKSDTDLSLVLGYKAMFTAEERDLAYTMYSTMSQAMLENPHHVMQTYGALMGLIKDLNMGRENYAKEV